MTQIRIALITALAAGTLALAGCSGNDDAPTTTANGEHADESGETEHTEDGDAGHEEEGHKEGHEEGEAGEGARVVRMDAAARDAAGVRVVVLKPSTPSEQLRAPGEVLDSAYGTTLITPRVESLVVSRHARLGDEVRAGAPLVTLASVEVSDAQAELRIAEQEWRRVSALGREAVSGRRIAEAQVAMDRARAKAQAYGLPGTASGRADGQFTLTAPHAGRITEDDFVVGERVDPGKALYRLVDESVVWVDAKVPSGSLPRISVGTPVAVVAGEHRVTGQVMRSAHRTMESTRTAVVRIEVPNPEDLLHAGDFVDVYLDADAGSPHTTALSVPTVALVQLEGETVVFRLADPDTLEAVAVRPGTVIGDTTVIDEGLKAGESVVVEGAFALKAQLLKAQLGEGHAH